MIDISGSLLRFAQNCEGHSESQGHIFTPLFTFRLIVEKKFAHLMQFVICSIFAKTETFYSNEIVVVMILNSNTLQTTDE